MRTAGAANPSPSASTSWRNVSKPRSAPTVVAALSRACFESTSSVYDSSSLTDGTGSPARSERIASVARAGSASSALWSGMPVCRLNRSIIRSAAVRSLGS